MSLILTVINFILHFDLYLTILIQKYGPVAYLFMFLIIFLETGFVIAPFLPGDSLLFVAGTFASLGSLNIFILLITLIVAAILGDSVNYSIGKYLGEQLSKKTKLVKKDYLDKTENFYRKHGGKAIILARFLPIIRTFAPFVAGVGKMKYSRFLYFNIIGGISWVSIFLLAGYFFGKVPIVKENLTIVIIIIVVVSLIFPVYEYVKNRKQKSTM